MEHIESIFIFEEGETRWKVVFTGKHGSLNVWIYRDFKKVYKAILHCRHANKTTSLQLIKELSNHTNKEQDGE